MTRVRCLLDECLFWYEGFCGSGEIELDPELGCLTVMADGDLDEDDEEWDDENLFDEDEWEDEWDEDEWEDS